MGLFFPDPSSQLADILAAAEPLPPRARAELLYRSEALQTAHETAAARGDTAAPPASADVDLHYVCFVKSARTGHLWELDGRRRGPLDRGALPAGDDVLSARALELGARRFLQREAQAAEEAGGGGGDVRFSLLVLAPALE